MQSAGTERTSDRALQQPRPIRRRRPQSALARRPFLDRDREALPILLQDLLDKPVSGDLIIGDTESLRSCCIRRRASQSGRQTLVNELTGRSCSACRRTGRFRRHCGEFKRAARRFASVMAASSGRPAAMRIRGPADIVFGRRGARRSHQRTTRQTSRSEARRTASRWQSPPTGPDSWQQWRRKTRRRRVELFQRHRSDFCLRRGRHDRRGASYVRATANSSTGWPAMSSGCSPSRRRWGLLIASICGSGRKGSRGRW